MRRSGAVCGFPAILLWSTSVALARSLSERIDPLTAAAAVYGLCGLLAFGRLLSGDGTWRQVRRLPRKYLFGCGGPFILYLLGSYLAVGPARNREQVLEVGLLNYLWPVPTIVFSLIFLGKRAAWLLLPGTCLALFGVFLVLTQGAELSGRSFAGNLAGNPAAYGLGTAAGISWALYSPSRGAGRTASAGPGSSFSCPPRASCSVSWRSRWKSRGPGGCDRWQGQGSSELSPTWRMGCGTGPCERATWSWWLRPPI